jgi:diaminopimelate epimerase
MRYVNADGTIGTMCGNGARCLVLFARRAGMDASEMRVETDAGVFRAKGSEDGPVRIYQHALADYTPHRVLDSMAEMDIADAHYIWTGTEHLVCFVDHVADTPVGAWGPVIRQDEALAPAGANIDFVEVIDDNRLLVRTYEKGVEAETLACGTGAVASAVVARMLERTDSDRIDVDMPGGRLTVGFRLEEWGVQDLYLEGPAEAVYRGTFEA